METDGRVDPVKQPPSGRSPTPAEVAAAAIAAVKPTIHDFLGKPKTGEVVRIEPGKDGGDPLVRRYLDEHLATCAFHTISWLWLLIGVVTSAIGGLLGNHIPPLFSSMRVAPSEGNSFVQSLHPWLNNPEGVLYGVLAACALTSLAGLLTNLRRVPATQEPWYAGITVFLGYLLFFDTLAFISVVTGLLCVAYLGAIAFRIVALVVGGRGGLGEIEPQAPVGGWPIYTVLVPLYRERNVARNILASLDKLDYPRDQLDVKFLLESDDPETLQALQAAGIPYWAEVVIVPLGQPKTKPRACNHGLARARGEYLVIFDAEDRPEPDQLKQAVAAFSSQPERVVCLQAMLAYHNHRQNLLTRWFALEYNVWFRRYLGGLERMRVPIPLGGTSNHFRTAPLRSLGGWDPFNVTEDCDLGVRLRIAGMTTRMLDSTTWEEANSRVGNWIRQRSRWIKGYLVTHLVWCRRPLQLVWKLGPWSTLGFLLTVWAVAALAALNLVLWVVTAVYLTLLSIDLSKGYDLWKLLTTRQELYAPDRLSWPMAYHGTGEDPFWSVISQAFFVVSCCLLLGNVAFVVVNAAAGRRKDQKGLGWAALISPLYWVLISIAAWKGLWQLLVAPHYWEKTVHGLDEGHEQP